MVIIVDGCRIVLHLNHGTRRHSREGENERKSTDKPCPRLSIPEYLIEEPLRIPAQCSKKAKGCLLVSPFCLFSGKGGTEGWG